MKRPGQVHRQNGKADGGSRRPSMRAGQFQDCEARSAAATRCPPIERARLRRLRFRRSDHQHDGGRKRNDGQRIVCGEREPLHDADRDRSRRRPRSLLPACCGDRCGRSHLARPRCQSRFIGPTTQKKGAADRSAAPGLREKILLQVGHRGQVSRELDDAGRAAPVGAEATRVDRGDAGQRWRCVAV